MVRNSAVVLVVLSGSTFCLFCLSLSKAAMGEDDSIRIIMTN